jgi:hypothetical protein
VGDDEITVEVPAGSDRTFTLTLQNPSVTVTGEVTEDLTAGEEVDITISLELSETKLIIPDADYYGESANNGGRLIQINGLNDSGWIERDYNDFGLGYSQTEHFIPYDVDFDNKGRIYVANHAFFPHGGIIRFDHINDQTPVQIIDGEGVASLAIDRNNGLIYYLQMSDGYELKRCNLDGLNEYSYYPDIGAFTGEGIAIDNVGMLYIATDSYNIYKVDPSGSGSQFPVYYMDGVYVWDVLFKDGFIYAADADAQKILKFDPNNIETPLDDLGDNPGDPSFDGPRRFVAIVNRKFFLVDEDFSNYDEDDSLVSFEDFTGLNFASYQNLSDPFSFYMWYGSAAH